MADNNGRVKLSTLSIISGGVCGLALLGLAWGQIAYYPMSEGIAVAAKAEKHEQEIQQLKRMNEKLDVFINSVNEERATTRAIKAEREREERRRRSTTRSPREDPADLR